MTEHSDWQQLVDAIGGDDRIEVLAYNASATAEFRLEVEPGPLPYFGDVAHAPVVLLISHPSGVQVTTPVDLAFQRSGWPLAALHPHAPSAQREWWYERLGHLIAEFGAQTVANTIAAIPLTPWPSVRFDRDLRLPSRRRMLALAVGVAKRGALIVTTREPALWTEAAELASLPRLQNLMPRTWRTSHLSPSNLGDEAWLRLCGRIESHARTDSATP